ncbi:polysaccharide biosynthesis tyrosine autokinase [cf. Phormidesmis sp. LEGE 11477]|nr:polysaccharide biosynthesis tyrosine autokinase [cf. Phormidesmis sp. LEGE 11477]
MTFFTVKALQQEKVFRGQFRMLVEPVNASDDLSDLTSILATQNTRRSGLDYATQVQVLRSPELMEPVLEELQQTYPTLSYPTLLRNLQISRPGETKILEVSYLGSDPVQIQVVLDFLAQTYLEYSLKERQTNLRQGINFVESQLPDLQARVDTLQDQLEAFRRQANFITPETQSGSVTQQAGEIASQRMALNQQQREAEQAFSSLQETSGALATLENAPIYQQLLGEMRAIEVRIAEELTRFEPGSLPIRVLEEQRENILPLLNQEAQRVMSAEQAAAINRLEMLAAQNEILEDVEQTGFERLNALPSLIREYTDLQRELEVSTAALTRFRSTQQSLAIEAAQTEIPWQIIEAPTQPKNPISPDLERSLLTGMVISVLLGLGAALLLEKLDNVYHTVDELKAATKLPLLGALPTNQTLKDSRTPGRSGLAKIADRVSRIPQSLPSAFGRQSIGYGYGGNSDSSFLEALRVLYTNIRMLSSDQPIRSILLSSAQPAEGKSTIAANLAQVATAMGQRVLIVDIDLRKPQVHDRLDIPNEVGLSNLITDSLPLKAALQQVNPEGSLFAITAGKIPPDSTKLLSSHKMQQLMATFEKSFDLVIYDSTPITGLADVSLVGQQTDGLVLITRMGVTDRTVLKQTIETLKLSRIPILGVVANGVKATGLSGYRYYAYGYGRDANGHHDEVISFGTPATEHSANGHGANGHGANGNGSVS